MNGDTGLIFILALALRIATFLGAVYHAYRVISIYRERGGGQRFQNVLLALIVVVGTFAIVASGFREIFGEQLTPVVRFVGAIATGTLFVGMATITLTWLLDSKLKERVDQTEPRTRIKEARNTRRKERKDAQ